MASVAWLLLLRLLAAQAGSSHNTSSYNGSSLYGRGEERAHMFMPFEEASSNFGDLSWCEQKLWGQKVQLKVGKYMYKVKIGQWATQKAVTGFDAGSSWHLGKYDHGLNGIESYTGGDSCGGADRKSFVTFTSSNEATAAVTSVREGPTCTYNFALRCPAAPTPAPTPVPTPAPTPTFGPLYGCEQALEGHAVHLTVGKYVYTLKIGQWSSQKAVTGFDAGSSWHLGNFESGLNGIEYYTGGDSCGGAGDRKSVVTFTSSNQANAVLASVREGPTCTYNFALQCPAGLLPASNLEVPDSTMDGRIGTLLVAGGGFAAGVLAVGLLMMLSRRVVVRQPLLLG